MKDVDTHIRHIIDWIQDYFVHNGPGAKAIIGISGGKDSTIAAALCVRALGANRVIGVKMPCGVQKDIYAADEVINALGIESYEINIEDIVAATYDAVGNNCETIPQVYTNTPARVRMSILYAIAAMNHGRVCNTCNRSEDYVGYSTKFGDSAGDFSPLSNYTVSELLAIGDELDEIPNHLIHKVPDDGMCGRSDEDNFGFTYEMLDNLILNNIHPPQKIYERIMEMHRRNVHKLRPMPTCPKYHEHSMAF